MNSLLAIRRSFNTQPPEGGCKLQDATRGTEKVSTHSRPKAADLRHVDLVLLKLFQHTAARRRLLVKNFFWPPEEVFQHTAARRRLRMNPKS